MNEELIERLAEEAGIPLSRQVRWLRGGPGVPTTSGTDWISITPELAKFAALVAEEWRSMYPTNPNVSPIIEVRDRPDLSVLVTDEMAEAGAKVLLESGALFSDCPDGSEGLLAQRVFEAMARKAGYKSIAAARP